MTLNTENFAKLVAFVAGLEAPIDFGFPTQCFAGMIYKIEGGANYGVGTIASFLNIPDDDALHFYSMTDMGETRPVGFRRMDKFQELPLAKQKAVLLDFLHTYRTEGLIAWDKAFTLVRDGEV